MTPIGKGYTADVFAWGDGRVLKLYHAGRDPRAVDQELAVTQAVHRAGLPAPAAYEVVEVEGRRGVVFERIEGPSLFQRFERRPWTMFDGARMLAELQARLHATPAPAGLPRQLDVVRARTGGPVDLPDGDALCHGDFHPGNIILSPKGPVLLDWGTASAGHPLGDVACTIRLFRKAPLPPSTPAPVRWLFAGTRKLLERLWLAHYRALRPYEQAELARFVDVIGALPIRLP